MLEKCKERQSLKALAATKFWKTEEASAIKLESVRHALGPVVDQVCYVVHVAPDSGAIKTVEKPRIEHPENADQYSQ